MFKASHFVAAILCAVTYTVLNPEHQPPHVVARLQTQADIEAMADALQAEKEWIARQDAVVRICLHKGHCR